MRKLTVVLLLTLIPASSYVSGRSGASFLKISPGAGPAGMGGAHTAYVGGINSMFYNPAGIRIDNNQFGATHTELISDIKFNYAAGVFRLREGSFGVSATILPMGEMEGRGDDRELTEEFGAYDLAFQVSYAGRFNEYNLGGSIKLINQVIGEDSSIGAAVDMGIQKDMGNSLEFGAALRNIGPQMKFLERGYHLPMTLSIGAGYKAGGFRLALDADYEIIERNMIVSFGTEYIPFNMLTLRGGYLINALTSASVDTEPFNLRDGFSGGIGLNIFTYSLDYTVIPYADFGTTQRVSLSGRF